MKKHYLDMLSLMLIAVAFMACRQEARFSGTDNYILEFALKHQEQLYPASIEGAEVLGLSIPKDIEPSSLTAVYQLSTSASIHPLPEKISEWRDGLQFTVKAKNGAERVYTLRLNRSDVRLEEDIVLHSDEEIKAFAAKKIDVIKGSLTLGSASGSESIIDLSPLATLREVSHMLKICPSVKAPLSALRSLETVGALVVEEPESIEELRLETLKRVHERLSIESSQLKTIALPALRQSGDIRLETENLLSIELPQLATAYGIYIKCSPAVERIDMASLQTATNLYLEPVMDWSIKERPATALSSLDFPVLEEVQRIECKYIKFIESLKLPRLRKAGEILMSHLNSLEAIQLPELLSCKKMHYLSSQKLRIFTAAKLLECKDFKMDNASQLEEMSLPALTTANIEIRKGTTLKRLDMPALTEASLDLWEFKKLENLTEVLSHVQKLHRLQLYNTNYPEEVLDLSALEVLGDLNLIGIGEQMQQLKLPAVMGGELEFNAAGAYHLAYLPQITGLEECASLKISGYNKLMELELPQTLKIIRGDFSCNSRQMHQLKAVALVSVGGEFKATDVYTERVILPALKEVRGKLDLVGKSLQYVETPKLTIVGDLRIGGTFSGYQNLYLKNLDFLQNLQEVGKFEIKFCQKLRDYTGIKKALEAGSITAKKWNSNTVHDNLYNPSFEDLKAGKYVMP